MKAITESELDMVMLAVLLLVAIAALSGMLPQLGHIFPNLMAGMYRIIDIIKDNVPMLKWI